MSPTDFEPDRRKPAPARRFAGPSRDRRTVEEVARQVSILDGIDATFVRLAGSPGCVSIEPASLEPLAEELGVACEDLYVNSAVPGASATLSWNLELAARAYGDAIDVVLGTEDEKGDPFNPATDYQWAGVVGESDLALVIGVAREARDCAAREAGLPERPR